MLGDASEDEVVRIVTDTRNIALESGAAFAAIKGVHHDGHEFISEAHRKGVRVFICEQVITFQETDKVVFLVVDNTIKALQKLAATYRSNFQIPIIAITGSNGKTVVKEWLNQMLSEDFQICRSPRSFNSQLGVALSLLQLEPKHQLGIFEAGISKPGEMDALESMIQPSMGVFTFVGTAHSENFLSQRQLIGEKLKLFKHCNKIICPQQSEIIELLHSNEGGKPISYKTSTENAFVTQGKQGTVTVQFDQVVFSFTIPFSDRASADNAISCIYVLLNMGYDPAVIQHRLDRLQPLEMRLQMLRTQGDCLIVNDSYSNDLQSLEIALDFLSSQSGVRRRQVIISDMIQSGMTSHEMCFRISELLLRKKIERCIIVGPELSSHRSVFPSNSLFFSDAEGLLLNLQPDNFKGCALLVKGARQFRLERVVTLLQERTHETLLDINLNAVSHNLSVYRSMLQPSVKIMAMVKAFGYGSGIEEMASLLSFNKVDYLAVAYADEGAELRRAGISLPIMVMHPEPSSIVTILRYKLEPEIYSVRVLQLILDGIEKFSFTEILNIHLKIDTGMHRLGFLNAELTSVLQMIKEANRLRIASVFTHLAAADNAHHDDFTKEQVQRFAEADAIISSLYPQKYLRHVLNTAGLERFPNYQFDMIRTGIGLYGVSASGGIRNLLPVGKLTTRISQIKNIAPGESVGYDRSFIANKALRVATIPVGYADGLTRKLSNGKGQMFINGNRAPILGKVCMDMSMIDVTGIECYEGDEVEIFGDNISLQEFSYMCDTIPYEVLTSIGQRVRRIYRQE